MARRPSQVRRRRRRSRELMLEGLEGRQLLAANVAVASEAGASSSPLVRLIDAETGAVQASKMAFESSFKGGVRLAMGRVTGNAAPDVVVGTGSGRLNAVRVFRPVTSGGTTTLELVTAFRPFGPSYQGGVEVAVGDVDGDSVEEIIVSQSREGGDVKVFRMTDSGATATLYAMIAKPFGANYNGGSSVAVADVGEFTNGALVKSVGDNKVEIVVGSGAGIPGQVRVYDVSRPGAPRLADSFVPFGPLFTGGVSVTSGRYSASGVADSIDDIVVSAGRGGASQTRVFDGTVAAASNTVLKSFSTYASLARPNAAVFTAAVDVDGNGQVDRFLQTQGDPGGPVGIANVSVAGVRAATPVTTLAGPLRIAAARTVFQTQTINGTVATPSPTAGVAAAAARPMQIREIVTGSGATAANSWELLTVQYTGMLTNGTVFDTSRQAGRDPFQFALNGGEVIQGWNAGLAGMKVGGRRLLVIPPELAYGDTARPGIPAGSTLVFDVELIAVTANQPATISGTSTGEVTENGATTTTGGTLTVTDPNDATITVPAFQQSVFAAPAAASLNGTYGTFTFNASTGVWLYTLDNARPATQALTAGQEVTDKLTVTSRDGTASREIVVTVTGAADTASIGGTSTGTLTAGVGAMTSSGTLTVTDADAGQSVFAAPAAGSLNGTYGTFTFNPSTGAWTYALDTSRPATLLLRAPATVTDTLAVTSTDGSANKTITVTITGFTLLTTSGATRVVSGDIPVGTVRDMQYADMVTGTGATAAVGSSLSVTYKGILTNGTVFDSGTLPNPPAFPALVLGAGTVIAGWDYGLVGMKVGGQRLLVIPPELAYGDAGFPPVIPSGATLVFKVELTGVA